MGNNLVNFNNGLNNVNVQRDIDRSPVYQIPSSGVTFTKIYPYSNVGFDSSSYSHLYGLLTGIFTTNQANDLTGTTSEGGLINTSLNDLPLSWLQNGAVIFNIDTTFYEVGLSGNNFRIQIPLTTTAMTSTVLYSSFINESMKLERSTGPCGGFIADELNTDNTRIFETYGLGYQYMLGENPPITPNFDNIQNFFESGVVLLFSDDWSFSGATTGSSWSYAYGNNRKYANRARLANFYENDNGLADRAAGLLLPYHGIGIIFAEDFVENFNWLSGVTSGSGTTEVSFNQTYAAAEGKDLDVATVMSINLILSEDQFNYSLNPSFREEVDTTGDICAVGITELAFYSPNGECLIKAVVDSQAIQKEINQTRVINLKAPIGEDIDLTRFSYTNGVSTGVFPCDSGSCV